MKPKNFPQKKLRRKLIAQKKDLKDHEEELKMARDIRTKKHRNK